MSLSFSTLPFCFQKRFCDIADPETRFDLSQLSHSTKDLCGDHKFFKSYKYPVNEIASLPLEISDYFYIHMENSFLKLDDVKHIIPYYTVAAIYGDKMTAKALMHLLGPCLKTINVYIQLVYSDVEELEECLKMLAKIENIK